MTPGWLTRGKLRWLRHLKDRCVESWVCRKLASNLPYESHECVRRAHSTDDKAIWWKHTRMHRQYLLVHSLKRVEKKVAGEKKENMKKPELMADPGASGSPSKHLGAPCDPLKLSCVQSKQLQSSRCCNQTWKHHTKFFAFSVLSQS